ncbi:MAG: 16S rRNA (cytidine(1402)-2'-O)-methyltransferase [Spirochaetia bacterium]
MGRLYIVGTPIGNLSDITLRAIESLKEADFIACEDTRHTQRLLQHYGISKPLLACHQHNEKRSASGLIKLMKTGKIIAYCSDAGTPGLSDPGAFLVAQCIAGEIPVIPIPGVSAFATLVSVSGIPLSSVRFVGFLPHHGAKRERFLLECLADSQPFLIYESPYRVDNLLQMIHLHAPQRSLVIGREMTKLYEEFLRGSAQELIPILQKKKLQGEFSILVASL